MSSQRILALKWASSPVMNNFTVFYIRIIFFFKFCWSSQEGVVKIKLSFLAIKYCPNSFTLSGTCFRHNSAHPVICISGY